MQWSYVATRTFFAIGFLAIAGAAQVGSAADDDRSLSFGEGKLQITTPEGWQRKEPPNRVIQFEFAVPAAKGDERDGRMTISGAGGTVEANVERWAGQFLQPDGSDSKKALKQETKKIAGQEVHFIDIGGTYKDSPGGPFSGGPVVERKGYRMLAAIITTKEAGNYFIKFYGPEQTVADNRAKFEKMVDSLTVK